MLRRLVCVFVVALVVAAGAAAAEELALPATRDARIMGHRTEVKYNGGTSSRLRAVSVTKSSAEFVIMDFDRAALKAFVDRHKGKALTGKLVVFLREVQRDTAKVEVASLDSATDWNEGERSQQAAEKGECCAAAAQLDVKEWTRPDGTKVNTFRDLIYDAAAKKIRTVLNSKSVEVKAGQTGTIEIELDEKLLRHIATNDKCRGIFLFHRSSRAQVDFFSREQNRKVPRLTVAAN